MDPTVLLVVAALSTSGDLNNRGTDAAVAEQCRSLTVRITCVEDGEQIAAAILDAARLFDRGEWA